MTSPALRSSVAAATVLTLAVVTGCGPTTETSSARPLSGDQTTKGNTTTTLDPAPEPSEAHRSRDGAAAQEMDMIIEIRIDNERFTATVDDTPAGRDLLAQLPQTIHMADHGGVEKTGPLQASLSLNGQHAGADPAVGDLGYYAPGHDLVLYYGDQSYYDGIVILGHLDGAPTSRVARMAGDISATVSAVDAS